MLGTTNFSARVGGWTNIADAATTDLSKSRVAIIGDTAADVRDILVLGDSGLLRIHPSHRPIRQGL
jgi:phage terminase large subunit-like protein